MRGFKHANTLALMYVSMSYMRSTEYDFPPVFFGWGQSFSAVVGPNGSGKSNVIDAMLFVFGKRAKQVIADSFNFM